MKNNSDNLVDCMLMSMPIMFMLFVGLFAKSMPCIALSLLYGAIVVMLFFIIEDD